MTDEVAAADDVEEVDAADEVEAGDDPGRPRRSAALVLAISLAVVFAVLAAVAGVIAAGGSDGDPQAEDVREAAGAFATAFVTYDHTDPDAHRDQVLGLATGSFAGEYEDAFDQGLRQLITESEAVSEGFVKDVYVSEVDEAQAQAIVVVDIQHDGAGGPRTLYDVYFRLTFVQVDGAWKVDEVTDLNFDAGTTGETGTATTTTAPGSSSTSVP